MSKILYLNQNFIKNVSKMSNIRSNDTKNNKILKNISIE